MPRREGWLKKLMLYCNGRDMLTCLPTGRREPGTREGIGIGGGKVLWQV
jgi:hypothetical protein